MLCNMESTVEALQKAYEAFVGATACVLEAKEDKTMRTEAALENFKQHWELFRVSCDRAEEFVDSVRQRIASDCLVDEATGTSSSSSSVGIPPISAVRLEQMSKAVRWLVIELQHGSSNPNPNLHSNNNNNTSGPPFGEDAGQP